MSWYEKFMHGLFVTLILASPKPVKPKVVLRASPVISIATYDGTTITLFLSIEDADEKFWCPGVRWQWPDGTESFEESDCDPYEKAEPEEVRHQSWVKRVKLYTAGEWTFTVSLEKSGKVIGKYSTQVHVG